MLAVSVVFATSNALVRGSKHVVNTDSGHEIHKDQSRLDPRAVDAVRAGKTSLP
jgi:hypothetical protein